jgi:hypothetical protein
MAASDYAQIFFKNRLHLAGRPQMSPRPKLKAAGPSIRLADRSPAKQLRGA